MLPLEWRDTWVLVLISFIVLWGGAAMLEVRLLGNRHPWLSTVLNVLIFLGGVYGSWRIVAWGLGW